jgi:probable F420-dependent oxidoreductase
MPTKANIGILVPGSYEGSPPQMAEFARFFSAAEELGFESLWFTDRIFHRINILDPFTLMTCAAASTSKIRLGTAVILFVLRNPVLIAKTTATLDYMSGGRLTLGISLGGRDDEFKPLGVDLHRRVSRFTEGLEVMRRLWSEDLVTFHGRHYDLEGVSAQPKPARDGAIPVILGGRSDGVLKRSGQSANGWVAGSTGDAEAFAGAWRTVQGHAADAGKHPDSLESGKLMYITTGPDRDKCKQQLAASLQAYYGPNYDVEASCAYGPPEECAAKIQPFIDAGAKTVMLGPCDTDVEQIRLIARDVLPLLG